jgi:hypothetical protein
MKTEVKKLRMKVRPVDGVIAELSSRLRATEKTPEDEWLPLADSVILATAIVEHVSLLYTINTDFILTRKVSVAAPGMSLSDWVKRYGTASQKKLLRIG